LRLTGSQQSEANARGFSYGESRPKEAAVSLVSGKLSAYWNPTDRHVKRHNFETFVHTLGHLIGDISTHCAPPSLKFIKFALGENPTELSTVIGKTAGRYLPFCILERGLRIRRFYSFFMTPTSRVNINKPSILKQLRGPATRCDIGGNTSEIQLSSFRRKRGF
jgi:hypothetical protein